MPAVQTSYTGVLAPAVVGMIANSESRNVISRTPVGVNIGFGAVALRGPSDGTIVPVGTSGAGAYLGLTVLDPTLPSIALSPIDVYVAGETAAVITKGVIWVQATAAVTQGAAAYYDATGNISAATGGTAIPNATFDTSTTGAGLAVLRLS
jgi:hypothetical protein